jgi:hypothetical protein
MLKLVVSTLPSTAKSYTQTKITITKISFMKDFTLERKIDWGVFESRVLKRIFGKKGAEVTGGCRKLHNEELRNFYSSPNIIRMIKSRRMG